MTDHPMVAKLRTIGWPLLVDAADEIELLRAENARLTTENGMLRQDLAETRDLYDQHRQGNTKLALKLADTSHALGRARALISWIDGACTDQRPHADIEAAITRWKDEQC